MRRLVSALAAACLGVLMLVPGVAQAACVSAGQAGFADAGGGIHLWAPIHEPDGRFANQADAVAAAKKYDLITILPGQLASFAPAMRAANPNLRIFVYMNGSYFYKGQVKDATPAMISARCHGRRVKSKNFGNPLGDLKPRLISYKQKEAATTIEGGQGDGVYLDMLGSAPTMPGYNTGLPINPATKKAWTADQWLKATANVAGQIASYTHKPVLGNGFGNGPRYFNPTGSSKVLLNGATGMTAEAWLKSPAANATSFETEAQWKQEVDLMADANNAGGETLLMTKTWGAGTTAQITNYRLTPCPATCSETPATASSTSPPQRRTRPPRLTALPPANRHTHHSYAKLANGAYQRTFTGGQVAGQPHHQAHHGQPRQGPQNSAPAKPSPPSPSPATAARSSPPPRHTHPHHPTPHRRPHPHAAGGRLSANAQRPLLVSESPVGRCEPTRERTCRGGTNRRGNGWSSWSLSRMGALR